MRCLADMSLRQAAKVLLPLGVPGTGLTRPGYCLSGGICNHADHLVSEAPHVLRQSLRIQMHYASTSYIIARWQLLPRMLIKPHNEGEPPIHVLEGKGKCWPCLPFLRLGTGTFCRPDPSEFCLRASLDLFSPRLAVSRSACLHGSRCAGAGHIRGRSLCNRRFLHRSLLSRSSSSPSFRLA